MTGASAEKPPAPARSRCGSVGGWVSRLVSRLVHSMAVRPHSALLRLQSQLFRSQVLRMVRGIRSPRRIALSLIALALAGVWTVQTVLAVLFREPADPAKLREWIALGMYTYVVWHLIKAAVRPTDDPLEWTPSETEWLRGGPLDRAELLGFRVASIVAAAAMKAACFCLVMTPDVHQPVLAFAAMLMGLLFVDLLRLTFDLFAWGLNSASRKVMIGLVFGAVALVVAAACARLAHEDLSREWIALGIQLLGQLQWLHQETPLRWGAEPLRWIADLALSDHWTWNAAGQLAAMLLAAIGATNLVGVLDQHGRSKRRRRERQAYAVQLAAVGRDRNAQDLGCQEKQIPPADWTCRSKPMTGHASNLQFGRLSFPRSLADSANAASACSPSEIAAPSDSRASAVWLQAGIPRGFWQQSWAIAWTQMLGARYFAHSLLVSFVAPLVLSLMPIVFPIAGVPLAMQIGGSLAFYSYVLLPTAVKFDFRRNIDRILIYKQLPLSSLAVVFGQLATPIVALTLFQLTVLGAAHAISDVSWSAIGVTLLLLAPTNALVIALENLTFVLYPYRIHQEGIEIFLRSVLMFTAKGLLAAAAIGAVLGWSLACTWADGLTTWPIRQPLFLGGLSAGLTLLAFGTIQLVSRSYRRFDVTCDLP